MLKLLLVIVLTTIVLLVAVFTGGLFVIWPTSFNDAELSVTPHVLKQLQDLQAERKFLPDEKHFYPGAPNEAIRIVAQLGVDSFLEKLIAELPSHPKRSFVLGTAKNELSLLAHLDSEEQDRTLLYYEQIMLIAGVTDSGELLNVWRYGLPYGWFP
jgi:hypothetical protein